MHVSISVHVCEHQCVYDSTLDEHMYAQEHMHVYMLGSKHCHICAFTHVCTSVHMCMHVHMYVCDHKCPYVRARVCIQLDSP